MKANMCPDAIEETFVDARTGTEHDWKEQQHEREHELQNNQQQRPAENLRPRRSILKTNSSSRSIGSRSSLSSSSSSSTSTIGVTFSQRMDVREIRHFRDLSPEEIKDVWYANEDFDEIKKSLIGTLRLMMSKKPILDEEGDDDELHCIRGLEFRTPQGAKRRKQIKVDALTAVWNEQVKQWQNDVVDDESIRQVYLKHSDPCRMAAYKFGIQDQLAIQDYKLEDNNNSSNNKDVDCNSVSMTERTTSVSTISTLSSPSSDSEPVPADVDAAQTSSSSMASSSMGVTTKTSSTIAATHGPVKDMKLQVCMPWAA